MDGTVIMSTFLVIDGSAEDKKDFQVNLVPRTVERTVTGLV